MASDLQIELRLTEIERKLDKAIEKRPVQLRAEVERLQGEIKRLNAENGRLHAMLANQLDNDLGELLARWELADVTLRTIAAMRGCLNARATDWWLGHEAIQQAEHYVKQIHNGRRIDLRELTALAESAKQVLKAHLKDTAHAAGGN